MGSFAYCAQPSLAHALPFPFSFPPPRQMTAYENSNILSSIFPFASLLARGYPAHRGRRRRRRQKNRVTMSDDVGVAIRVEDGCGTLQKCGTAGQNFVSCCPQDTVCTSANDNTYVRKTPIASFSPTEARSRGANA